MSQANAAAGIRRGVALALAVACLAFATIAGAVPPPASIRDFDHVAWTTREGAPAGIWAMAQSADGWLWLGNASGLFRFDGVTFERADLIPADSSRSRSVGFIAPMASGDLWVAYSAGGASLKSARDPAHPRTPPGLPDGTFLDGIIDAGNGEVWAKSGDAYYRFTGDAWQPFDATALGLPAQCDSVVRDTRGNLWANSDEGLWVRRHGRERFEPLLAGRAFGQKVVVSPRGAVWQRRDDGFALVEAAGEPAPALPTTSHSIINLMDADGAWWSISCLDAGVCRRRDPSLPTELPPRAALAQDAFDTPHGLSGLSMTVMHDREGNVWVGTKNGLDRFRPRALTVVDFPEPALYFAMVPEPSGGLWVGTASMGFRDVWRRLDGDTITAIPGLEPATTVAYRDRDGSILVGGPDGLWRFDGTQFHAVAIAEAQQGSRVQAITRDGRGRLWIAFRDFPLQQWNDGQWIEKGGLDAMPDLAPVRAVTDDRGDAWFGYLANRLVRIDAEQVREFGEAQGLDTGTVTAILPEADHVLVGGEQGLSVFDGTRFRALQVARPELLKGITGLLRTADGTLWINGIAGALRVGADELQRALDDPAHRMTFRLFDASDGLPGGGQQARPLPTIVQTTDGRLWFAAASGLAWLDPASTPPNRVPPPVAIRFLSANGVSQATPGALGPDVRELRLGFSALQFAMPEKLALRYRLDGHDTDWQDAGTRREATYTNLPPGQYRFRVTAANEDGLWNPDEAQLAFDIAPAFHETRGFAVLLGAAALAVLWLLYRMRLASVRRKLRQESRVRQAERERIARDLHDTLLQGVQGLLLRLQTWAADTRVPPAQRADMDSAATQARDMLVEGRDRIVALRSFDGDSQSLGDTLAAFGNDLAATHAVAFGVAVVGEPRRLDAAACEEILAIAREALRNAFAHADAGSVRVTVTFTPAALRIDVCDDGCGIAPDVLRDGGRAGHWGLSGMRERALRLGASLDIAAGEGAGTRVSLRVPARIGFRRGRGVDTPLPPP